jgi:hypothetical protein
MNINREQLTFSMIIIIYTLFCFDFAFFLEDGALMTAMSAETEALSGADLLRRANCGTTSRDFRTILGSISARGAADGPPHRSCFFSFSSSIFDLIATDSMQSKVLPATLSFVGTEIFRTLRSPKNREIVFFVGLLVFFALFALTTECV